MIILSFFLFVYIPETLDALINVYKLINKAGNYCTALQLYFLFNIRINAVPRRAVFINILALRCGVYSRAALIRGNTVSGM